MSNMNVTFNIGDIVGDFTITSKRGVTEFTAESETTIIGFRSDSGEGRNYSKILWSHDKTNGRTYRAMRYLLRDVSTVQEFSNALYIKYKAAQQ